MFIVNWFFVVFFVVVFLIIIYDSLIGIRIDFLFYIVELVWYLYVYIVGFFVIGFFIWKKML